MNITETQVAEWMIERFNECVKITPRGPVQFEMAVNNFSGNTRYKFGAYSENLGHTTTFESSAETINSFRIKAGAFTPQEAAARLRAEAQDLIAKADYIETQAATL
jgi:hypothetical protein